MCMHEKLWLSKENLYIFCSECDQAWMKYSRSMPAHAFMICYLLLDIDNSKIWGSDRYSIYYKYHNLYYISYHHNLYSATIYRNIYRNIYSSKIFESLWKNSLDYLISNDYDKRIRRRV
jgi:hypothetical protein